MSKQTVVMAGDLIRKHRRRVGSRWRKASPGRQALLALAVLRHDQRLEDLAGGNGVSASTLRRWVLELVSLLAARAPRLDRALARLRAAGATLVLVDGTLVRTRRRTGKANRRHYSGKHKRHGLNVQALTDTRGRLLWISCALPGSTADITAARRHNLLDRLRAAGLALGGDKGYHGLHKDLRVLAADTGDAGQGQIVITPVKAETNRPLTDAEKLSNSVFNGLRCAVERAFAALKTWRILDKLRLNPRHATTLLRALLVLVQHHQKTPHPTP
ncbi:transposase family protein [Amycolatopsis sp. CFH S0078]|uniref:transposase family protein n=3 Tax=unclassified Amycolatopsis TaxID=2618356 RepID=UPI00196A3866|nr:transposase family protein [Amycolatopsis sp. CFH S0078]